MRSGDPELGKCESQKVFLVAYSAGGQPKPCSEQLHLRWLNVGGGRSFGPTSGPWLGKSEILMHEWDTLVDPYGESDPTNFSNS